MSADAANNQELILKKRARRRLVGAIALVVLMLIILPQILQDRAVIQHESIKIIMPDATIDTTTQAVAVLPEAQPVEIPDASSVDTANKPETQTEQVKLPLPSDASVESRIAIQATEEKNTHIAPPKMPSAIEKSNKKTSSQADKPQHTEAVKAEVSAEKQNSGHFTVQIGVYSDADNVKRLQSTLKQAGYTTSTEKMVTEKGERVRLKAGKFSSRQDAVDALAKLKTLGLSGIVVRAD